jgi:hypothetical protein
VRSTTFSPNAPARSIMPCEKWPTSTDAATSGGSPETCVTHEDDMPWRTPPAAIVST